MKQRQYVSVIRVTQKGPRAALVSLDVAAVSASDPGLLKVLHTTTSFKVDASRWEDLEDETKALDHAGLEGLGRMMLAEIACLWDAEEPGGD